MKQTVDYFYNIIQNIRINKNNGHIAPHKPLFLLLLLKIIKNGHGNDFFYDEIVDTLSLLLRKYTQSQVVKPQYPFVFLDECIWTTDVVGLKFKDSPSRKEVLGKKGKLNEEFFQLLISNNENINKFSELIIKRYFEQDCQEELNNWMNE